MLNETIVRFCAPTMACIKTGSMINVPFADRQEMLSALKSLNQIWKGKGIRILPLRWQDGRALLYLYRPGMLEEDLRDERSRRLLDECGYTGGNANECIAQLIQHLKDSSSFPHEVGLFLGYPPADVDGFMHCREECKLCGLWKVYDDVDSALKQFRRCRRCTEEYLRRYSEGSSLESLTVAC